MRSANPKNPRSSPAGPRERTNILRQRASKPQIGLVVLAAVAALAVAFASTASADFFGGRYADNDQHRYQSIECNDADHTELNKYVKGSMRKDYEDQTNDDINTILTPRDCGTIPPSTVDVYWYATDKNNLPSPTAWASVKCVDTLSNNKCDQFRMRFNEDTLVGASKPQKKHTVCHEIAHTLGSDDGDQSPDGCFPQSTVSLAKKLNQHEINHLKAKY